MILNDKRDLKDSHDSARTFKSDDVILIKRGNMEKCSTCGNAYDGTLKITHER